MSAARNTLARFDIRALLDKQDALRIENDRIERRLFEYQEACPDAWMLEMDASFQRVAARLTAKLEGRAA
jgi:hypothetical protein